MKVAAAEAVSMNGTSAADQAGRIATGKDGTESEADGSFLSAVASAINAKSDEGSGEISTQSEVAPEIAPEVAA